jgi:hypothetical protein
MESGGGEWIITVLIALAIFLFVRYSNYVKSENMYFRMSDEDLQDLAVLNDRRALKEMQLRITRRQKE